MTVTPFKNKKFSYDLDKNPQYGIVQLPVANDWHVQIYFDIEKKVKKETLCYEAKTSSNTDDSRSVKLWRVPLNGFTGKFFTKMIIEANKIFNYKISSIQDLQYLEYEVGDYYKLHTDINNEAGSMRKISFSFMLNTDYEGGELVIYNGGTEYIAEKRNDLVIAFTSFYTHSVRKVTKGTRKVLVCWANGESWR